MSKIGINDIVKAYHGSAEVSKIYLGTTVVYEAGGGALPDYLCFTANQANSKVTIQNNNSNNPNVEYSTDDGTTWATFPITFITLSNVGDKMYVRGNNPNGFNNSSSKFSYFNMSGSIDVSGNIMSLIDTTLQTTTIPNYWCFTKLFLNRAQLRSAEHLKLPATTLTYDCYRDMFNGCTSLTTAPNLPATTLVESCYQSMFSGCTALTSAPALPATTLANNCYQEMFAGCTSLTAAPTLPATTLATYCYYSMFSGCTSLTAAPALPATTLASSCYANMFRGCTSLTAAPELPATTLVAYCYNTMFYDCINLNYIKAMFTTTPDTSSYVNYTKNWISGIGSSGSYIMNSQATWNPRNYVNASGIPLGWIVYDENGNVIYDPYAEGDWAD